MPIEVRNLSHVYMPGTPFESRALRAVSLSVQDGEFVGIIGHTGSGKSTLISYLNGLERTEPGVVFVNGVDLGRKDTDIISIRHTVGLVFQYPEYQLFEETVAKDMAFGPINMGKSEEEIAAMVADAARFTGVDPDWMEKSPFELSGGQKRRVAMAGVIAMDPDVLVLDEPAAGLDPRGRDEILSRLKAWQMERDKTLILISHSMEDMARYADEIVMMKNGAVFCHGKTEEVFSDVEKIREAGLELPQITRLMARLSESGVPVDAGIHTVKAAADRLASLLRGGDRSC